MTLTQEEWETVLGSKLFAGIAPERLREKLSCLHARRQEYKPGEYVVLEGQQVPDVGLVLSGQARSLKTDREGEPLIISLLERGSFLGILLAASRDHASPVSVQAQEPLSVLFFPAERLIFPCGEACGDHALLTRDFLDSVAEMSLAMNDRISCLLRPTVREKALSYLVHAAGRETSPGEGFTVPLDRNAMARYLNVERSALSRELSRMKADGLIEYRKNHFKLLKGRDLLL